MAIFPLRQEQTAVMIPPILSHFIAAVNNAHDRLTFEAFRTEFSGVLSQPLLIAIRALVASGFTFPVDQSTAMRCHLLTLAKSKTRLSLQAICKRRQLHNPRLGVQCFGDLSILVPEEHKLEFPLLSDPNNIYVSHCRALLWKEETLSCCGGWWWCGD